MSEKLQESLSALMDGEANELELQRLLASSDNEDLRATWSRFNLVRGVTSGLDLAPIPGVDKGSDFAARVRVAVGVDAGGQTSHWERVKRPFTSLAVAASVAAAVVVGGIQINGADSVAGSAAVAANVSPVGFVNSPGATPVNASFGTQRLPKHVATSAQQYQDLARKQMNRYMRQHAEQAALNSPQGLVPFVRASYTESP